MATNIKDIIQTFSEKELSLIQKGEMDANYHTGVRNIDKTIKGFSKGDLVVIAGDPDVCSLLRTITLNIFNENNKVVYCSMHEKLQKIFFLISKIVYSRYRDKEYMEKLEKGNLFLDGGKMYSLDDFCEMVSKLHKEEGVEVVSLDGITDFEPPHTWTYNTEDWSAHVCHTLKRLALELNILLLVRCPLSKPNYESYYPEPRLCDLGFTFKDATLSIVADYVLALYRPEKHGITEDAITGESLSNIAYIYVLKNNTHPTNQPCKIELFYKDGIFF